MVHNSGRVSRLYLQRLDGRGKLPALGNVLPVTQRYLEAALDELDTLGTLLATAVRCKLWSIEREGAIAVLYQRSFDLMVQGRWMAVRKMCNWARDKDSTASLQEVFQANEWLAHKRLDNFAEVKQSVENWDVTALHDRFRFAQHVLLDDFDRAFPVATRLLKSGDLSAKDLASWPMLDEFRKDPRYEAMLDESSAA